MNGGTDQARTPAATQNAGSVPGRHRVRPRRRWLIGAATLLLVAAAGAYVQLTNPGGISFSHPLGQHPSSPSGTQDNGAATSSATVTRRSLSATTPVNGTLGYAGDYKVLAQLHGTITWLPKPGDVRDQGQVLYRVDEYPVVLLTGSTPAYRSLAEGATAADVTGPDVAELNHDLVALGYLDKSNVEAAWDEFNWATKAAVEKLQKHLGVDQTGTLTLGQAVFLPTTARIATVSASLGGPAGGPVLTATSTTPQVTVNLDANLQSEVKTGDTVTITLPDSSTTAGTVSTVGKVATAPSSNGSGGSDSTSPTVPVEITPNNPSAAGDLDEAPVQVAITTATAHDVLVVPVNALLALSGGGYAVEVDDLDSTHHPVPHHLVRVSLGLFDDAQGLVQVSSSGLTAGQHIVVPAS